METVDANRLPEIALDARWVGRELSGIARYTLEILRQFGRLQSPFRFCVLALDQERAAFIEREAQLAGNDRFTFAVVPYGPFSLRGQWAVRQLLLRRGTAVYHSTNFMIPLPLATRRRPHAVRCICNIHDLIPLAHPEFTPRSLKTRLFPLYRALMREIARRADGFLTVSHSAKQDIVQLLGIDAKRIVIAPDAVNETYQPSNTPKPSTRTGIKTILYVGRSDPYKNLEGLIRAFAKALQAGGLDARIQIVGPPDARYPEAPALARDLGVADQVEWLGYVDDAALVRAYQDADLVALLSRYEGFGLPVAEAMACGTPVLCSNAASLPEVAGGAARLVAPDDVAGAASAIRDILLNPAEAARLREAGLTRAKAFNWQIAAETVLRLYGEMA